MPYTTALCCIEKSKLPNKQRLQMCSQNALRFWGEIAEDDLYKGLVQDPEEGTRFSKALSTKKVSLQQHHGRVRVWPQRGRGLRLLVKSLSKGSF